MLGIIAYPEQSLIEVSIAGPFSMVDVDIAHRDFIMTVAEGCYTKILANVIDLGGMNPSLFWNDLRKTLVHVGEDSRIALLAQPHWVRWLTTSTKSLARCELEYFNFEEGDLARIWLDSPIIAKVSAA